MLAVGLQARDEEVRFPHAVKQRAGDADPPKNRIVDALIEIWVVVREAQLIEAEHGAARPQERGDPGALDRGNAEFENPGGRSIRIERAGIDALTPRGGVEATIGGVLHAQIVVEDAGLAREPGPALEGARIAGGDVGRRDRPAGALAGDDIDHAAHGARAVEARHRAADHLDAIDVAERVDAKIVGAVRVRRIVDRHAVAQHQHLVGVGAADERAGVAALAARLHDVHPRHRAQRLDQRAVAAGVDGRAIDDGDAGGDLVDQRGDAGGGDDLVGQLGGIVLCEGGQRKHNGGGGKKHVAHNETSGGVEPDAPAPFRWSECRLRVSLPLRRCTPPVAREQSRCRPVSWLAGLGLCPPSHLPRETMARWAKARRLQLRGQPRLTGSTPLHAFPFSPCGHRHLPVMLIHSYCALLPLFAHAQRQAREGTRGRSRRSGRKRTGEQLDHARRQRGRG